MYCKTGPALGPAGAGHYHKYVCTPSPQGMDGIGDTLKSAGFAALIIGIAIGGFLLKK